MVFESVGRFNVEITIDLTGIMPPENEHDDLGWILGGCTDILS